MKETKNIYSVILVRPTTDSRITIDVPADDIKLAGLQAQLLFPGWKISSVAKS